MPLTGVEATAMRKQFILAATLIAAIAIPAAAGDRRGNQRDQGYNYRYNDQGYGSVRDRDNSRYGGDYRHGNPVTAAMRDLESVFRRARVDHHEANHFRRALRELAEFDRNAMRGRFDRGSLDSAMDNMADLAQADQLHPRDRQLIGRRLQELAYFRERVGWR